MESVSSFFCMRETIYKNYCASKKTLTPSKTRNEKIFSEEEKMNAAGPEDIGSIIDGAHNLTKGLKILDTKLSRSSHGQEWAH